MKLGDLEFKPEDFEVNAVLDPGRCAYIANRLLAERLEKTRKVYGNVEIWTMERMGGDTNVGQVARDCLEKLRKP